MNFRAGVVSGLGSELGLLRDTAKMPLSGLCALERCGLSCCGRHGVQRCAPGACEKPVAFCRTLVLFSQKENSRNCVWVAGGLSPCEMCVLSSPLICNALA